jgi:uncharacterized membrane protein
MKTRHIYLMRNVAAAEQAIATLRTQGVPDDQVALVARADHEMARIPHDYRNASTDFKPAALRGAIGGGTAGMLAGLVGVAVPALGITLVGAAAVAAIGAAAGAWASALAGSALSDPIRRQFEQEIAEGRILLLVDCEDEAFGAIDAALVPLGAQQMDFTEPSALG